MKELEEPEEAAGAEDDEDPVETDEVETSLDEIVAKTPDIVDAEDDDESMLDLSREERLESLSIRAIPKQANEFVCASCHLVKNNSQLADRKRTLCRDCV
ncbi:MAG: DUF4193 family protein [Actinomycetota bacterium]